MTEKKYRPNVGLMIVNAGGNVLMCERVDDKGAFQMPQGGIDAGETPEQAAWRELSEETGLARDDVRLLGQTRAWHQYDFSPESQYHKGFAGQRQKWFLFLLTAPESRIDFNTHHVEFQSCRWMSPDEALAVIWPGKRPVYRAAFDELKPLFPAASARPAQPAPAPSKRSWTQRTPPSRDAIRKTR